MGLGVQGLADAFIMMRFPFDSEEARQLNKDVFETIYYAACCASKDLAIEEGPYETFKGSPASEGKLQFDLWGVTPSDRWEWDVLKEEIMDKGMRNSLLVAPMPTASTAQILGNNECFEPYTSNIYTRRTLSGEFIVVNNHLLRDLTKLGMWNETMKNQLIAANGSIQNIQEIPENLKALYRTAWEISQRAILDMAADRGALHLPVAVTECLHGECQCTQVDLHALPRMALRLENRHVLPAHEGRDRRDQVHRRQEVQGPSLLKLEGCRRRGCSEQLLLPTRMSHEMTHEEQVAACSIDNGPDCEMCSG